MPTVLNVKSNDQLLKSDDFITDHKFASFNPSLKISKAELRNCTPNNEEAPEVQQQFTRQNNLELIKVLS
jgi:hypothetical protein